MISNWAKCIKLKLVILDWISKQFSDTSFPVGSADRWSMLSFLLEENNYQEDKAVLFGIRKKYDTHTHTIQSQSTRDTGLLHNFACSFWPMGITCAPFWRWQGLPGWRFVGTGCVFPWICPVFSFMLMAPLCFPAGCH